MPRVRQVRRNPYPQVRVHRVSDAGAPGPVPSNQSVRNVERSALANRGRLATARPGLLAPGPSAFQAGHIPSCYGSYQCSSLVAGRCRLPLVVAVAVIVAVNSAQAVVGELPQLAFGEAERAVAGGDDVLVGERGPGDPLAVHEGAIAAAEVDDLMVSRGRLPRFGMVARNPGVIRKNQVVAVGGPGR